LKKGAFQDHDFRGFFAHLLIGLIVLLGGGFLLDVHTDYKAEVFCAITFVFGWLFRGNETNGNGTNSNGGPSYGAKWIRANSNQKSLPDVDPWGGFSVVPLDHEVVHVRRASLGCQVSVPAWRTLKCR
jgi:hypothetical protein